VLRAKRFDGHKFRRQHPIPPYVVDFVSLRLKLVIELDGSQHTMESDAARTRFLKQQGFRVIRFWDNDVLLNLGAVAEAIFNAAQDRTLSPTHTPAFAQSAQAFIVARTSGPQALLFTRVERG